MARIERQEVSNKSTYIVWFWSQFSVCSVYEADRIDVTIMRQSYSATNWQQEVCDFQNALNSPSYFYPICFKLNQNTVKTWPMWKLWREYWYLKYCCHGNVSNLNILFLVIWGYPGILARYWHILARIHMKLGTHMALFHCMVRYGSARLGTVRYGSLRVGCISTAV